MCCCYQFNRWALWCKIFVTEQNVRKKMQYFLMYSRWYLLKPLGFKGLRSMVFSRVTFTYSVTTLQKTKLLNDNDRYVVWESYKTLKQFCTVTIHGLWGAISKFRKATVSILMSHCPSVRMEHLGSHKTDICANFLYHYFSKICTENSSSIKILQELRVRYMNTNVHVW